VLLPGPESAGTVVVVVVVGAVVVVVVVLGGTVVVVPSGLTRLTPPGAVVVVVVVDEVVVVVGATVVVVVLGGTVVVGVDDGVDAPGAAGVAGVAAGVGAVMTAVVQAPAFCKVSTSATRRTSERFSLASSDVNVRTSCCSAFWTPFRCTTATFTADLVAWVSVSRSPATKVAYWWATTPFWFGVPNAPPVDPLTMGLLWYRPLFMYSSTAKRRSAACAAAARLRAVERIDWAADSCWLVVDTVCLAVATAVAAS
jgi:hypothetical protein